MEKQTRMSKYRDLRAEMMEEVPIHHSEVKQVEEDDDFLAFIPKKEERKIEDTLMEPLTYETLDKNDEGVRSAITRAKANVGKEQYNTRLDILSKIKGEELKEVKTEEKKAPVKKMSLLEKLASMSPEEDVEELKKFQNDEKNKTVKKEETVKEVKKEETEELTSPFIEIKEMKKVEKEEIVQTIKETNKKDLFVEEVEEEQEEKESKVVTVLNYAIIALMLVFVVLICFIIKEVLF